MTRPTLAGCLAVVADLLIGNVAGIGVVWAAVSIWPDAIRSPWTWMAAPLAAWVLGNRVAWLLVSHRRRECA
jgi:hypothetical protein